ncbi:MAG: ABC-2 transporter permease [Gammaproteobacteria bacterium]
MKAFFYLLKREVWEHPAFYVAPSVVGLIVLALCLTGFIQGVGDHVGYDLMVEEWGDEPSGKISLALGWLMGSVAIIFNVVFMFIFFFYLLDALYAERKERSILFWKSLPITDTEAVLAKVATAVFVMPILTLAVIAVTHIAMMLITTVFIWTGGGSAWQLLWGPAPMLGTWSFLLYALVVETLWYFPFIGWLLFASALARRTPFLWGVLPIVFIGIAEEMFLGTERFFIMIGERIQSVFPTAIRDRDFGIRSMRGDDWEVVGKISDLIHPAEVIKEPGLWGGFAIGAGFILIAILLRRYRDES